VARVALSDAQAEVERRAAAEEHDAPIGLLRQLRDVAAEPGEVVLVLLARDSWKASFCWVCFPWTIWSTWLSPQVRFWRRIGGSSTAAATSGFS